MMTVMTAQWFSGIWLMTSFFKSAKILSACHKSFILQVLPFLHVNSLQAYPSAFMYQTVVKNHCENEVYKKIWGLGVLSLEEKYHLFYIKRHFSKVLPVNSTTTVPLPNPKGVLTEWGGNGRFN